jgi:threonine/homoserine/homoserine lactone efflux protein
LIYLQVFLVGMIFSFLGSVPPGTLNLCVLQLGLEKKTAAALRFALAVSIIEYPYTWIGVQFEYWITSSPQVIKSFHLITAVVMVLMGILNMAAARKPAVLQRFNESGFRRGIVLSILNPMAIPFWIVVTAYLKSQAWIDLSTTGLLHSYLLGTAVGAMVLLTLFTFLAERLSGYVLHNRWLQMLPGITLLVLGLYALGRYLF